MEKYKSLIITSGIFLALAAFTINLYRNEQNFWLNALPVTAELASVQESKVCSDRSRQEIRKGGLDRDMTCRTVYIPIIRYTVEGKLYQATSTDLLREKPTWTTAEAVYDPKDPSKADLLSARSFVTFNVVFSGAFALVALALFIFFAKDQFFPGE